jgi:hypothetical protein
MISSVVGATTKSMKARVSCACSGKPGIEVAPSRAQQTRAFFCALPTGRWLGNASNSGPDEKCYWWLRICDSTQGGGEASASDPNDWRGSKAVTESRSTEGFLAKAGSLQPLWSHKARA